MHLLLFSLLFCSTSFHEIQIAHFEIYEQNNSLKIDFVFDHDDILNAQGDLDIELTDEAIQQYINSNFSLSINNIAKEITFENMSINGEHIEVAGEISNSDQAIVTIDIQNTCLLNIEKHSNIVKLKLHDKQRDFLMNKDRTSIRVTY